MKSTTKIHKAQSVAYVFVPLLTFAFGWDIATFAIPPIFLSYLILVFAEWQWTRNNPYNGFDHKAGFGLASLFFMCCRLLKRSGGMRYF